MSIGDFLSNVGHGLATGARAVGAVAGPVVQSLAEEESGQAPEIQAEKRQQAMNLQNAAISSKAKDLESQLEMGRKYGTLTPDQQQQYVDAITTLYSHPSQMPTLIQKIHNAVHPGGAPYQAPATALPTAVPKGGTAEADTELYANRTPKLYVSPDGKQRDWFTKNDHPEGWTAVAPAAGSNVRQGSHIVIPNDAIELMNSVGAQFNKQDGTPWSADELAQFPEGTALAQFVKGDMTFYSPIDQRAKTSTFNNLVQQIPEAGRITPQNLNPLGLAKTGETTTHQVPGMNPGEKITLTGTSTPVTPVTPASIVSPSAAITPKTGAQPVAAPSPKTVAQLLKPQPSITKGTKTSSLGTAPPPFAPGTMLSQGRIAEPVVASMSTVAAQVFGSNGEPPIWENAWMFDKPELRTALNRALTLNALSIPGTEDDPSFAQTLMTAAGVTGMSQDQIDKANVRARQDLKRLGGDDALKMFARMAGMQEDLSALRSATKSSAAGSQIRTLVRAAPVYNVASSQNFRDQLGVTLNTATAAMSGYPAINPKYLEWWRNGAQMARGGTSESGTQQPGTHSYAVDADGKRRKVLDPNAQLPKGWKWAD